MKQRMPFHKNAAIACALAAALATGTMSPALATESNNVAALQREATELIQRIDESTRTYQEAVAELEKIDALIAENEAKSAEIEAQLPEQRARTAASIKSLYLFQQNSPGLLELVLSSEDFGSFISALHYIDTITKRNTQEIHALNAMQDSYVQTQASLTAEREALIAKTNEARTALEGARDTRTQIQDWINAASNETEKNERVQAIATAVQVVEANNANNDSNATTSAQQTGQQSDQQQAAAQTSANTNSSTTTQSSTSSTTQAAAEAAAAAAATSTTTTAETSSTSSSDVSDWAARIDKYLEGTALAGYGQQFAQAAETYNVDPRIAPSIAGVESGWGQVNFHEHNAWGWGSSDWDSWDTAIDSYVKGFSSIYGSDISLEEAEMYASNDIYDEWYDIVQSEMGRI